MIKTSISALVLAALVTAGTSSVLTAHERGDREDRRAEAFAELDTNNDGSISADEFAAGADRFNRVDRDGNGVLTEAELAASGEERAERRAARMIERLDTNGDGALSRDEIEARRDPARLFDRLDTNDDGSVSAEEFAEARGKGMRGGPRHDR